MPTHPDDRPTASAVDKDEEALARLYQPQIDSTAPQFDRRSAQREARRVADQWTVKHDGVTHG